ncbi:MAG: DHH family phosphoesterase, partial [Desulfomonilaceae bacterium]
ISLRSNSRTQRASFLLKRLVGKTGSSGGHREMAGGQIPMSRLTNQQRSSLPSKLITKFLKMLKRESVTSKPLVRDD